VRSSWLICDRNCDFARLAFGQLLLAACRLGGLAFGHVLHGAARAQRRAALVVVGPPAFDHPLDAAVGKQQPVLDLVRLAVVDRVPVGGVDGLAVVRVDALDERFVRRLELARIDLEDAEHLFGPQQHVAAQVELPVADLRQALRLRESPFARAQALVGALALGDVVLDRDEVRDATFAIADRLDVHRYPVRRSVLAVVQQLGVLDALAARDRIVDPLHGRPVGRGPVQEARRRAAADLVDRPAGEPRVRAVDAFDLALRVGDHDQHTGVLDHELQQSQKTLDLGCDLDHDRRRRIGRRIGCGGRRLRRQSWRCCPVAGASAVRADAPGVVTVD
jgi:hypothetical protein